MAFYERGRSHLMCQTLHIRKAAVTNIETWLLVPDSFFTENWSQACCHIYGGRLKAQSVIVTMIYGLEHALVYSTISK
jgi:hypothetical protein